MTEDNDPEKLLWKQVIRNVKPLTTNGIITPSSMSYEKIRERIEENRKSRKSYADLPVGFYAKDVPKGQIVNKQVKVTKVVIESRLDLHDLSVEEAWITLQNFIARCQRDHRQWVLVITGKGLYRGGVIRQSFPEWMNSLSSVGAFSIARPQDGGSGAFYVRIKKKQPVPFS